MVDLNFWDKIRQLILDPIVFFNNIKSEKGIKYSLLSYTIVSFVIALIFSLLLLSYRLLLQVELIFDNNLYNFVLLSMPFIFAVFSILGTFVYSGFMHIIVLLFKGTGRFVDSYNVYAYSMIPYMILSLVPFVGIFAIFYALFLMTMGISEVHKMSKLKAGFAVLIPFIVTFMVLLVSLVLFVAMIFPY